MTRKTKKRPRRRNPRLLALYAEKGGVRLKYTGTKFAKKGRAMLFKSPLEAYTAAKLVRRMFPAALKGWALKASAA